jgi:hypothetical protein
MRWYDLPGLPRENQRKACSNNTWSCDGVKTGQVFKVGQTSNGCSKPLISAEDRDCTSVLLEQHPVRWPYYEELSLLRPVTNIKSQNTSVLTNVHKGKEGTVTAHEGQYSNRRLRKRVHLHLNSLQRINRQTKILTTTKKQQHIYQR